MEGPLIPTDRKPANDPNWTLHLVLTCYEEIPHI